MGIKQTITKDKLPSKYQAYDLIETQDGVTHSVYLLDDKYVLKIVNPSELTAVQNEQKLLIQLQDICVPTLVDIFIEENYILAFYTQIEGETKYNPSLEHIKKIAIFLQKFHKISRKLNSSNTKIYQKEYLKNLIIQTKDIKLLDYFHTIKCKPKLQGIIHGDLFCDNVKFKNTKLSGVYDFIEASEGDFTFDLAVVAFSWCFTGNYIDKTKVDTLLNTYSSDIKYSEFLEYIKYALLYYTTTRFLTQKNYKELLDKLEHL